ncbi:shikimate kinase [Demequina sp.]|uniref:shikimate kinase n=1 Tax=Demequina sp. TaxID=2050685 RepID=UPI0025BCBD2D|nr:shikimate kinase [Demequina sp.]
MAPVVVLIGPPGSGKSSVGVVLARLLGTDLRDTDADVEAAEGRSVADIFVSDGEQYFREVERVAVATAIAEHDGVLSLGGGAPIDGETQSLLAQYAAGGGTVAFLDVGLTAAVPRVGLNATRPLLLGNPRQKWLALMNERRPVYERLATVTVLTDNRKPSQIAAEIAQAVS